MLCGFVGATFEFMVIVAGLLVAVPQALVTTQRTLYVLTDGHGTMVIPA